MEQEAAPAAPGRAGVLPTVGVMALIAVVVAGTVVLWGRLAAGTADAPRPAEELPAVLADGGPPGEVPPQVADAVQGPVVGVRRLDEAPPDVGGCAGVDGNTGTLEYAVVTPDGLSASWLGDADELGFPAEEIGAASEGDDGVRSTCEAVAADGGWSVVTGSTVPATGGYSGVEQMTGDLVRALVRVPDDADWAVQDRGGYRLAYPVTDLDQVTVTAPVRGGGIPLTFLTGEGEVVDATSVGF